MNKSAMLNAKRFHDTYLRESSPFVIEVGSRVITGKPEHSLRGLFIHATGYLGLDFESGPGVDKVIDDPYALPIENDNADTIISSSCFEHSEFFWLSFLEMCRVL
jgi:hypothetical protein